jgi:hypothetical protein
MDITLGSHEREHFPIFPPAHRTGIGRQFSWPVASLSRYPGFSRVSTTLELTDYGVGTVQIVIGPVDIYQASVVLSDKGQFNQAVCVDISVVGTSIMKALFRRNGRPSNYV